MDIWHSFGLRKHLAIIFLAIFGLGGCFSYDRLIQSWVGKSESELIEYWGKPDMTSTFDDGKTIHTWINSETNKNGPYTCQKSVTINKKHTITKASSNGCPSVASYNK